MNVELQEVQAPETRDRIIPPESPIRNRRRKLIDRLATWAVGGGGFTIIASILAILLFILYEITPLFQPAKVEALSTFPIETLTGGPSAQALGLDENQEIGFVVSEDARIQFYDTKNGARREQFTLAPVENELITCAWQSLKGTRLALGTHQGKVLLVDINYHSKFFEGSRSYRPEVLQRFATQVDTAGRALVDLAFAGQPDESLALAALTEDGRVSLFLRQIEESLFGDAQIDSVSHEIPPNWSGRPVSIAMDESIRHLYIGTDDGKIYHWNISFELAPKFVSVAKAADVGVAIKELAFLIGSRTLMVGDAEGHISAWFLVRDATAVTGWRLTHIRDMKSHESGITALAPSARGKGFIAGDTKGNLRLQYSTSEKSLATFQAPTEEVIRLINYAPKANGALTLDAADNLTHWSVNNPHPEAGLKAFFGKVWYEGYEKPEYVWQSTGGSDDFEPKLSLVPLIFGSFKGTIYALIIAIPLAILAALYTSQFMHPGLRSYVKPTVEIMAALPSVVLGFLAGLWLAPRIEQVVPAVICAGIVLPMLIMLSTLTWRAVPRSFRGRFRPGIEGLLLIPVIIFGIWFTVQLNSVVETTFFDGDFKGWLFESWDLRYDQRNALVVGFAMGFAVIPIIYTISEDALANVPQNLVSGSLALGATRWQTAVKVVLPTAAAGIFSAIMIGLGRAVGETMIVLMATGNTPIMDWNMFNGFRTLSANIAVEIPEAPVGGTLYRVLFLAAMLLFMITFAVNTLAEVVRQRLRERYQKL
ncbi:ABC transporter permease subunit [bacterium]|nr:ABC transporter permease subunit [bacterium]